MQIAIIGTGALASLFAARLRDLADIVMVGSWQAQIEAVQENGLTLIEINGRSASHPLTITNNPHSVSPVDVAVVLVKSYQTETAVSRIRPLLAPNGLVVTLQNGVGNAEILRQGLDTEAVTVGITSLGATMEEPGIVRHAGDGAVYLAKPANPNAYFMSLVAVLAQAGFSTEIVDDVAGLVWGKLAINCGINPLTAVLNVPNGDLAENEQSRRVMIAAAQETAAVAAAQGIQLPYPDVAERVVAVAQATAQNRSSMLQDLDRGSRTEIDGICGAVVKMGEKVGVKTAVNQHLLTWIKQIESGQPVSNLHVQMTDRMIELSNL